MRGIERIAGISSLNFIGNDCQMEGIRGTENRYLPLDGSIMGSIRRGMAFRACPLDVFDVREHHTHINLHPSTERHRDGEAPVNVET